MLRSTTITTFYTPEAIADWIKTAVSEEFTDLKGDKYKVQIKVKPVGKKSKSSWHTVENDPLMRLAANYVKNRDNWQCRKTGIYLKGRSAHCAHIISRSCSALRYDPENLLTLSAAAHKWFDENKDRKDLESEQGKWLIETIGLEQLKKLLIKSQIKMKRKDAIFQWKIYFDNNAK